MKIFTHTYNITLYDNGKFCWKNNGWVIKESLDITGFDLMIVVAVIVIIFW